MNYDKILEMIYILRSRIKNDSRYFVNGNRPAVCSDETLQLIAKYAPTTIEELKNIKGIGETFIEKYGTLFVDGGKVGWGGIWGIWYTGDGDGENLRGS